MKIIESPDSWASVYSSLEEARLSADSSNAIDGASKIETTSSWAGTANWEEASLLVKEGAVDLGNRIARESSRVATALFSKTHKTDVAYDVQGQVIDMGRYLEGDPYCVLNLEMPEASHHKTCEIVVNMTCASSTRSESILNRGIAIAVIVKTLEAQGISCRLWATYGFNKGGKTVSAWVKFKEYTEPLRLHQLAFLACHPASLRRFGFALGEVAPQKLRTTIGISNNSGYGRASEAFMWGKIPVVLAKTLYFPIADNREEFETVGEAKNFCERIVNKKMERVYK